MFKKLISIILIVSLQSVLVADDYSAGGDFSLDNALNFHGDVNFSNFTALGAQSVLAGMDFDGDSLYEILFSIDETLAPGGLPLLNKNRIVDQVVFYNTNPNPNANPSTNLKAPVRTVPKNRGVPPGRSRTEPYPFSPDYFHISSLSVFVCLCVHVYMRVCVCMRLYVCV